VGLSSAVAVWGWSTLQIKLLQILDWIVGQCRVKFHEKILKTIHFVLTAHSTAARTGQDSFWNETAEIKMEVQDMLLFSSDKE
jgi:hypothetical protein